MPVADPYEDLLARLRTTDVGRVGARESLREVLRRLPGAWDPRVLEAALEVMRRFPELKTEFAFLEQMAAVSVTTVVERALGREETVLAAIAAAGRPEAERLLHDLRAERGRAKQERARLQLALGRRLLDLGDRKNARTALREASKNASAALRPEIDAILDDLPGAKGREWRGANGNVVVGGTPSEPAMLRVKGRDAPPRIFVEERLLGAPLLSPCSNPHDAISVAVSLEHDTERVRTGSVRPRDATTAPMIGLVARDPQGNPIGVLCGAFASPIDRFSGTAIAPDVSHVSIRAGASWRETQLEPVGPPKEGDGWLVVHDGRPFVRTRGGCWLRYREPASLPPDTRVRFRVTRAGLVWVAANVTPIAP